MRLTTDHLSRTCSSSKSLATHSAHGKGYKALWPWLQKCDSLLGHWNSGWGLDPRREPQTQAHVQKITTQSKF